MEIKVRKSLRVMGCALVATALAFALAPAQNAHAASKPAKVTKVKVSKVKTTSAKVTWKKASSKSVKGYQVRVYKGKKTFKTYTVKGRKATSKTVTKLKTNTKYSAKVRAYKGSKHKKYGKWSSAKKFTTKKVAKKPTANKPSNTKPSNGNSGSTAHVHNYGAVKHPAVWKTVTVDTVRASERDPYWGFKPVVSQGYTEKVLVSGVYASCSCGKIKEHAHQWVDYQSERKYQEVTGEYYICACGEKFKARQELHDHQSEAYDNNLSGHGSSSVSATETWVEKPAYIETVTYHACSICGQVKSE